MNGIEPPEWARDAIRRSHERMTEAMRRFHISMGGSEETFQAILAAQVDRSPKGQDPQGLDAQHESAVVADDAPITGMSDQEGA